jgi:hypothetical protein
MINVLRAIFEAAGDTVEVSVIDGRLSINGRRLAQAA